MNVKKLVAMAFVGILGCSAMGLTSVSANTGDGDTNVVYENRNTVDSDTGEWGVVIPTSVYLKDDAQTKAIELELIGINGYDISEFNTAFNVTTTVVSANNYELKSNPATTGAKPTYKIQLDTQDITSNGVNVTDPDKFDSAVAVTKTLTQATPKMTGSVTMVNLATQKGNYTDTLTFAFTGNGKVLK